MGVTPSLVYFIVLQAYQASRLYIDFWLRDKIPKDDDVSLRYYICKNNIFPTTILHKFIYSVTSFYLYHKVAQ